MVEYKYNIIKEVLNKNNIPIDIQEMIVDKLVPEHQKINLVDEYKKLPNGGKDYFRNDVEDTYIKKVNFNDYDTYHNDYLEFDGEEREILNSCYDEDIYNFYSRNYWSEEDFIGWVVDNMLEKKKFYEITARHRYSFYKLYDDPSLKLRHSSNMIFTIDKYYEDKKNKYRNNYLIN